MMSAFYCFSLVSVASGKKKMSPRHLCSLSNIHVQLAQYFCPKEIKAELDRHAEL